MIKPDFFTRRLEDVDLHLVINKAVDNNSDIISDQVTNQLNKGLDGDGNDLGEYRNFEYKNRWKPVDLRLTGNFWRSIAPQTYEDYFEMTSDDPKAEMLTQKYGDAILNMNQKELETAAPYIAEDMKTIFAEEVIK